MPRGVVIPEIQQRLFAAVERVIARDGSGGLSGRSVTHEAGVATGLLYTHFTNLDEFLAAYAVDRTFSISAQATMLSENAGTGSIAENLYDVVTAMPLATITALVRLQVARPELIERVNSILGDRAAGLDALENAVSTYVSQEQKRGQLSTTADPEAIALALVGALHRLVLADTAKVDVHARMRGTISALIDSIATARPANQSHSHG